MHVDQEPVRSVHLCRVDQNINLYCTTDSNIICNQNLQTRKRFGVAGGSLFDLTAKGTLIGAPKDDNQTVVEFDENKKINSWMIEGDKLELRYFKQHYLIMLVTLR